MPPPALAALTLFAFVALAPAQDSAPAKQERSDAFLAGYVAAVLENELRVPSARVAVRDGSVTIRLADPGDLDGARIRDRLKSIPGVVAIAFESQPLAGSAATTRPAVGERADEPSGLHATRGAAVTEARVAPESFLLRTPSLFEPVYADPRWPHFSAAYHLHSGSDEIRHAAAVSFGESFSFYRHSSAGSGQWELGLQAGVNAIFDLAAASKDLVNADYFVGPVFAWRRDRISFLGRLYHQSSHLGDEYLLRTRVTRVNLSYEVLDLLASWDVTDALRVYGGGGRVLHSYTPLKPWLSQAGVEFLGSPFGKSGVRPLAALDLQARQQSDWSLDRSVRAGIQVEDLAGRGLRMQVLLEYYRGTSPNGQFFVEDIEYYGLGVHFYF